MEFTHAITKKPCSRFEEGITTAYLGKPDYRLALQQHEQYVEALKSCALEVEVLEPEDAYPDSCFVEDPAIVLDEVAVITLPGADSRKGEVNTISQALQKYKPLVFVSPPGTLEGGDVLRIKNHFFIGVSDRTNNEGARQLGAIVSRYGCSFSMIELKNVLHLKKVVNYIGNNNLLVIDELKSHPQFQQFDCIEIPDDEIYSANCLYLNGKLIMPKGFEKLKSKLLSKQYSIIELEMSEFEKMDGGLTCLSLRF